MNLPAEGAIPQDKRLAFGPRTIWFALLWIQIKGTVVVGLSFLAINPFAPPTTVRIAIRGTAPRSHSGRLTSHSYDASPGLARDRYCANSVGVIDDRTELRDTAVDRTPGEVYERL